MKKYLLLFSALGLSLLSKAQTPIDFTINVDKGRKPISQDIYGTNTYKAMNADSLNPLLPASGEIAALPTTGKLTGPTSGRIIKHHSDDGG